MKKSKNNLVWVDLEMTGLNPETDVILEIATIITDAELNILAEGPEYAIYQPAEVLDSMNDWCKEQHGLSGLTQKVQESLITLEQAEEETLELIKEFCQPEKGMLAGNTVWMDRNFLKQYMPKIIHYLHYKLIDVTSIQQLIKHWYPKNPHIKFEKADTHRALVDIKESIEELKHYRKYFFI
ncbi:MAG: oligoribonuclease [Candidatus Babeliales bacterium]